MQTSFLCMCVYGGGVKFDIESAGVTFKIRSRSPKYQNLIISSTCPNSVAMQVKSKSTNWFRRYKAERRMFTVFVAW